MIIFKEKILNIIDSCEIVEKRHFQDEKWWSEMKLCSKKIFMFRFSAVLTCWATCFQNLAQWKLLRKIFDRAKNEWFLPKFSFMVNVLNRQGSGKANDIAKICLTRFLSRLLFRKQFSFIQSICRSTILKSNCRLPALLKLFSFEINRRNSIDWKTIKLKATSYCLMFSNWNFC